MQMNVFMVTKELLNPPRFMSGEVVSNDVNLFATRLLHDEGGKKGDELLARMTRRRGAKDLSSLRVECRIQREGSVPEVLKPMPLGSPWRQRQYRIKAIQRLDGGLFVDAEHRSMLRRIDIQADDVGSLRFEVGIIRCHVPFDSMRLQTGTSPDPRHHHMSHSEFLGESPSTPMSRAVRRAPAGPLEDPSLKRRRALLDLAPTMAGVQSRETLRHEPTLPEADIVRTASKRRADRTVRITVGKHQNQARTPNIFGAKSAGAHASLQLFSNGTLECEIICCCLRHAA
jgi:hypothetical protein